MVSARCRTTAPRRLYTSEAVVVLVVSVTVIQALDRLPDVHAGSVSSGSIAYGGGSEGTVPFEGSVSSGSIAYGGGSEGTVPFEGSRSSSGSGSRRVREASSMRGGDAKRQKTRNNGNDDTDQSSLESQAASVRNGDAQEHDSSSSQEQQTVESAGSDSRSHCADSTFVLSNHLHLVGGMWATRKALLEEKRIPSLIPRGQAESCVQDCVSLVQNLIGEPARDDLATNQRDKHCKDACALVYWKSFPLEAGSSIQPPDSFDIEDFMADVSVFDQAWMAVRQQHDQQDGADTTDVNYTDLELEETSADLQGGDVKEIKGHRLDKSLVKYNKESTSKDKVMWMPGYERAHLVPHKAIHMSSRDNVKNDKLAQEFEKLYDLAQCVLGKDGDGQSTRWFEYWPVESILKFLKFPDFKEEMMEKKRMAKPDCENAYLESITTAFKEFAPDNANSAGRKTIEYGGSMVNAIPKPTILPDAVSDQPLLANMPDELKQMADCRRMDYAYNLNNLGENGLNYVPLPFVVHRMGIDGISTGSIGPTLVMGWRVEHKSDNGAVTMIVPGPFLNRTGITEQIERDMVRLLANGIEMVAESNQRMSRIKAPRFESSFTSFESIQAPEIICGEDDDIRDCYDGISMQFQKRHEELSLRFQEWMYAGNVEMTVNNIVRSRITRCKTRNRSVVVKDGARFQWYSVRTVDDNRPRFDPDEIIEFLKDDPCDPKNVQ